MKLLTSFIFHLERSGNDNKDVQLLNILSISATLFVSHLDISGNNFKDLQLSKYHLYQLHY